MNIKDNLLAWIERISGRIHNWAWDKRWKERDQEEVDTFIWNYYFNKRLQ